MAQPRRSREPSSLVARNIALPVIVVMLLLACVLFALHNGSARRRLIRSTAPNVLLVSIDTLRPDHLGCYGYQRATSPTLDRLAAEGVRFSTVASASSWTLPAHASLVTGVYPATHGAVKMAKHISPSVETLAQCLQRSGMTTCGVVSFHLLSSVYGFARGFTSYHELHKRAEGGLRAVRAEEVANRAIHWIGGNRSRPFFLFLHFFDPHWDYDPPPPYDRIYNPGYRGEMTGAYTSLMEYIKYRPDPAAGGKGGRSPAAVPGQEREVIIPAQDLEQVVALYDGEIRYTDHHLGRVIDALRLYGLLEKTLVVITADHGEEFMEHGSLEGHAWTMYEEVIRIPLIMRFPDGLGGGRVVDRQVRNIDIMPTILDWLQVKNGSTAVEGASLLPAIRETCGIDGTCEPTPTVAFGETRRFKMTRASARSGTGRKVIFTNGGEAVEYFDLNQDPGEQVNLRDQGSDPAHGEFARLEALLDGWLAGRSPDVAAGPAGTDESVGIDQRTREQLAAMGYAVEDN
jgi:arylsulfatase A-like enzyme